MPPAPPPPSYAERLRVPLRWWALATMFVATVLIAFLVATPVWLALLTTGLLAAATAVLLTSYGAARVGVHDGMLQAGRARISLRHIGQVHALDAEEARALAGRDADARAYLLLRPYLRRAVRVEITDPADPTPYWLVATRHPSRLTEALTAGRTGDGFTGAGVG